MALGPITEKRLLTPLRKDITWHKGRGIHTEIKNTRDTSFQFQEYIFQISLDGLKEKQT